MNDKQKIFVMMGFSGIILLLISVIVLGWNFSLSWYDPGFGSLGASAGKIFGLKYFFEESGEINWTGISGLSLLTLSLIGHFLYKNK